MAWGDNIDEGHSEGEEQFHFYYNREERLKTAPKLVQDYYSGNFRLNKGFHALVATKSNRFLLIVLFICLVLVGFTSLFASYDKGKIGGMNLTLTSFSFEEEIYVSIKLNSAAKNKKIKDSVPVSAEISFIDVDNQLSGTKNVSGIFKGEELYLRTKFPDYDILKVRADVSASGEACSLTASVQRK